MTSPHSPTSLIHAIADEDGIWPRGPQVGLGFTYLKQYLVSKIDKPRMVGVDVFAQDFCDQVRLIRCLSN